MDDKIVKNIVYKFESEGPDKFYRGLLASAIKHLSSPEFKVEGITPEKELIHVSDSFLTLYRHQGIDSYLEISKIFRKAAHKIYRLLLKKHLIDKNDIFLNLV